MNGAVTQEYHLIQIIPYLLVFMGGVAGINVFVVLLTGIVSGAVIMLVGGYVTPIDLIASMGEGAAGWFGNLYGGGIGGRNVCFDRKTEGSRHCWQEFPRCLEGKKGDSLGWGFLLVRWILLLPIIRWRL